VRYFGAYGQLGAATTLNAPQPECLNRSWWIFYGGWRFRWLKLIGAEVWEEQRGRAD